MSGKDAIIERIKQEGKEIALSTSEEGAKRGAEIIADAKERARLYREKNMTEMSCERDEIIRRHITSANLEVKKQMLSAKQIAMASAFLLAVEAVRKDERYPELLLGMLSYAEEGEKVTFSKADKELIESDSFLEKVKGLGKKILIDEEYGDFSGGVVLSGKGTDKNMSLETELGFVRDREEAEIAKLLFGD